MYGERSRTSSSLPTQVVELFMAGDVGQAKQVIRLFCKDRHRCVTVSPTTYIYDGGEELGFVVGFRAYPRFPQESRTLAEDAVDLGVVLRDALGQDSFMVVDHAGMTTWSSTRQGG